MLTKILIAVAVLIVGILAFALTKPDEFRVSRTAVMNASAAAVFEQINDVRKTQVWSPWVKMEPDATYTFEGPNSGKGAVVKWSGKKVGQGVSTIIESDPNRLVRNRLDFIKPFAATNTAEFQLKEENGKTTVTWSMYGPNTFIGKVMSIFMNCEKMIGSQFDQGLADLKTIVEKK